MELLIIKTGEDYIRVLETGFSICGMDKASVFPMEKLTRVQAHVRDLERQRFTGVKIHKLTIIETPFEGA